MRSKLEEGDFQDLFAVGRAAGGSEYYSRVVLQHCGCGPDGLHLLTVRNGEVVVDKDVVEGRKEPVRIYAKKEKTGSAA